MLQFDTGLPWGELILLVVLGLAWGFTLGALVGLGLVVALVVAASSTTVASTAWKASSLVVISTHLDS